MTRDEKDQAVGSLRFSWDEAYEIGIGPGGFWARRFDGAGETMISDDPGELRHRIWDDYARRPRWV